MSATLSLYSLTLAHGDPTASNNPSLRHVDWKRQIPGIAVENPSTVPYRIPPGASKLIFDGTRPTSIDGSTSFDLSLGELSPSTYRLTYTDGTDPVLRTDRGLDLASVALVLTTQGNGTLLVTAPSGTPFAALVEGDEVYIPGPMTGDASTVFSPINQGRWVVLAQTDLTVTLVRPSGQDFQGISETVTPASTGQLLGYSSDGVQIGDKLDISLVFATPVRKTFVVTEVTSQWVEFTSTSPLAAETGVTPTAAGMKFYSDSKRYVRIEGDQECVVRANGDTGNTQRLSPWVAGDPALIGEYVRTGPTWSLTILNLSTSTANVLVISAE